MMIAKLTGKVERPSLMDQSQAVIIDVSGVGYQALCSSQTLNKLPPDGEETTLYTEMWVREDSINLYGFVDHQERFWFKTLTTVQGVGAKAALSILSALEPEVLHQSIVAQDKVPLTQADGVGPKLAGRIINELKDKVAQFGSVSSSSSESQPMTTLPSFMPVTKNKNMDDAISALINLGYKRAEAYTVIKQAANELGDEAPIENLIRIGLKELSA